MARQQYDAEQNRFFLDLHGVLKRDAARVIRKRIEECSAFGIARSLLPGQPTDDIESRRLSRSPALIEAALVELESGTPFSEAAERFPDCKEPGGRLAPFERGEMADEFEDTVFALQPGERSGIFRTPFGSHIAELHNLLLLENLPPHNFRAKMTALTSGTLCGTTAAGGYQNAGVAFRVRSQ